MHFYGNGLAGRVEVVVLRGTSHGDLVRPSAQALKRPSKTPLILIVQEHVGMDSLGALGELILQLKAVADLVPVLGGRDHNLRPVLYWFIRCEDWCSAETAH